MIDTSVWVSLMRRADHNHDKAKQLVFNINPFELQVFDHVYFEILTVLRNKISDEACIKFINFIKDFKKHIIISSKKIITLANFLFFKYKKLSFTDCLLMASAKTNKAELITFDKELNKAWANESSKL